MGTPVFSATYPLTRPPLLSLIPSTTCFHFSARRPPGDDGQKDSLSAPHSWIFTSIPDFGLAPYSTRYSTDIITIVWTETREELNVLFTRAQQAQNDNYKKNIDNIG